MIRSEDFERVVREVADRFKSSQRVVRRTLWTELPESERNALRYAEYGRTQEEYESMHRAART